jgi:glutathione S-transferase
MQNRTPILYTFRRCPYAMRARMALKYSQIDCQQREILLKDKPPSMLNYSSKGTVPVLIVGDLIIDESIEIMLWALARSDQDNWLQDDSQFDLIQLCDEKFKAQLDAYKYSDRYELSEKEYRNISLWFLEKLEQKLSVNDFLMSKNIALADCAIFPFIRQWAFVNKKWFDESHFTFLQKWLNNWLESDLFLSIMHKYPLWNDKVL